MKHRPWPSRDAAGRFGPGAYADWRETSLGTIPEAIERRLILRLAGKVRGQSVLDVGCGNGALTSAFSQSGAAYVVGCDIDPQMIARASARGGGARPRALRIWLRSSRPSAPKALPAPPASPRH